MDKKSRDLVMGKLYLKNKDYKMAEKSFSDYLSSNPEDFQALKMLAQVHEHLNDTAKSFDLYQRCYLLQPDRKGVLLDICRLLLVNDSRLDYVDQKKWLKLAVQAFPTNPIVTNLRESLPNSQDSHPGRITTEDMILEKLTVLEDRFKNFEDRFELMAGRFDGLEEKLKSIDDKFGSINLAVKHVDQKSAAPVFTQSSTTSLPLAQPVAQATVNLNNNFSSLKLDPNPTASPVQSNTTSLFGNGKPEVTSPAPMSLANAFNSHKIDLNQPNMNNASSLFSAPKIDTKADNSTKPASAFGTPIPLNTVKPTNAFGTPMVDSAAGPSSTFSALSMNNPVKPVSTLKDSTPVNVDLKPLGSTGPVSLFGSLNAESKTLGENNESSFKFDGVNLFAESLKKMNLPSEGLWTTLAAKKDEPKEDDNDGGDDDDGGVATEELPIENTCDMKAIEIKTGEEDEDIVFKNRCKLFRFRDKEYKERGLGDIKVLKHKETGKGRLIMRRELVNLVCLNCWSCQNIERVRETQVRFAGIDASDGDAEMTVFLAKFKTSDLTDEFMKHLNDLFAED